MDLTKYVLGGFMAMVSAGAAAQDLTKEITVEKDIVPIERKASRIDRLPQLRLQSVAMKKLSWSDRAVSTPATATISTLPPAGYLSSVERPEYRGYVDAGYFPTLQAAVSAGYRFVDDDATSVGAWLQYDGSQYKKSNIVGNKLQYRNHTGKVGVDARHLFDGAGTLAARLGYMFSAFNHPTLEEKGLSQNVNNVDFGLSWRSMPGSLEYYAALDYGFFKFGKAALGLGKAVSENYGSLSLGASYAVAGDNRLGADLKVGMLNDSGAEYSGMKSTAADMSLAPYFLSSGENYRAKLGLVVGHAFNRGSVTYIAPDVKLEWMPTGKFTVYAGVDGGASLNSVASRFALDGMMINPSQIYATTRKKIGVDGGFLIGPFAGAAFKVWGSYASLSRQLMPVVFEGDIAGYDGLYMGAYDFKNINYGIMFTYSYRDIASGYVSYEGAPRDIDKGCSAWTDRAKSVFGAGVSVTPIDNLDISVDYRLRSGRAVYLQGESPSAPFESGYKALSLGNVNSLDLGASYRFNSRFSVWCRVENLLGSDWQENYLLPSKGVTGLVGAGYKF